MEILTWLKAVWAKVAGDRSLFRDLDSRIETHGWTAIYVGDYRTAPTWTYTLGFAETLNQPEVIVFDIPQDAANGLLWEAFDQLKDGRLELQDGKVWPEGEERPCVWRKVDQTQIESEAGWFTLATIRSIARTGMPYSFEAYQLVLSDNEGRLPWDDGYDERLRPLQPALYLPLEDEASPLAADAAV
jgi:hypothetical protein